MLYQYPCIKFDHDTKIINFFTPNSYLTRFDSSIITIHISKNTPHHLYLCLSGNKSDNHTEIKVYIIMLLFP